MAGTLYIVSTPIGNLEDITARALRILKEVDLIASEAPQTTLKLLSHFEIRKPLISYSEHKWYFSGVPHKEKQIALIIRNLLEGKSVALVSKAGTPLISDPGYELVNAALDKNIKVIPIPGVSAVITALSISGLPTDRFIFEGFLPIKKSKCAKRLQEASQQTATIILYEAPYRVIKTLKEIRKHFGNRRIALARELTKLHEETLYGTIDEIIAQFADPEGFRGTRGEYTIIVEGNKGKDNIDVADDSDEEENQMPL